MACDDAGEANVFLPSRVGIAVEPPSTHRSDPPTSLLTFADMVIALDSSGKTGFQNIGCNQYFDGKLKTDHTYASIEGNRIVTRSQTLRTSCPSQSPPSNMVMDASSSSEINANLRKTFCSSSNRHNYSLTSNVEKVISENEHTGLQRNFKRQKNKSKGSLSNRSHHQSAHIDKAHVDKDCCSKVVVKRSSSLESVQSQGDLEIDLTESSNEWPLSKSHSPRKSCSFEEVNQETESRKKIVQRGGSSGQLHRLVNDTLEFPCWPRKADHTYATATWDGTAASHNLFEQENRQQTQDHIKMEVTEAYILPLRSLDIGKYSKMTNPKLYSHDIIENKNTPIQSNQKDDHTYVKHSSNVSSNSTISSNTSSFNFSSATFPRQKSRDDHTYFHSGLNKRGKESLSSQDISDFPMKDDQMSATLCRKVNLVTDASMESVSTKKDHNYSSTP